EIITNLLIGDLDDAENANKYDIDIVINLSETSLFDETGSILYFNIPMIDSNDFPIYKYFDYIESIVRTGLDKRKKILINCRMGLSRSVISYAMLLLRFIPNLTAQQALMMIKNKKDIDPNKGFIKQLIKYGHG
ncbi:MAG TPA: dual specificity protein phosphatase, partial [Allocoleopsis sp.]